VMLRQGRFRAEKFEDDECRCSIWEVTDDEFEDSVFCWDFSCGDIDMIIRLLKRLKNAEKG